ncbi:MAG: tetratricopeptide repeat protein [Phycisphaerae bacterium]|nr:tetratricopeptide repeat protein [Phycisphaerae bacterium]
MISLRRLATHLVAITSTFALTAFTAPPAETAREAHELLSKGDVEKAIARYEDARSVDPDSPELAYNLGVANYRKGKFTEAAALFKEAAAKAKAGLAAKAMFNQGTSVFADALARMEKQPEGGAPPAPPSLAPDGSEPAAPPNPLDEAIAAVEQSVTHFRDSAAADPSDTDSRANAERAWRLLKKLREEKEKQEKQKEKQQQDSKDQKQDDKQDQKQQQNQNDDKDQKPKDSQGAEDQRKPEDEERNQSKSDQQQKDQGQEREQKDENKDKQNAKPDEKADPKKDQKGKPQERKQGDSKADPQTAPEDAQQAKSGDEKKQPMSRENAERLLQIVRDKEKERREQKARAERARQQPVSKDW